MVRDYVASQNRRQGHGTAPVILDNESIEACTHDKLLRSMVES